MAANIQHIFVLMLENRSFDHMLGGSPINGADAEHLSQQTTTDRLQLNETNQYNGQTYTVQAGAPRVMSCDPHHEFTDVLTQLCGPGAQYPPGGAYPAINNSGYVESFANSGGAATPGDVMKYYAPSDPPVLNALANEFVICDNWHASLPGPTWPNRMFVHDASSGGLDHSPTQAEIAEWETIAGFKLANGSIFDSLRAANKTRRLYAGDDFPMVAALKGIHLDDIRHFSLLAADLQQTNYPYNYVFIEPAYDVLRDYKHGNSQHPCGDVVRGEALIKQTYEAIRNSPVWPTSMLIITWDEHGGFYDHALSVPPAVAPGDTQPGSSHNQFGFTFEQYGPRVPALVISPWAPHNVIDHRLYDHSSIPATIKKVFNLPRFMTDRDASVNTTETLLTLASPRTDCPTSLVSATHPAAAALMAAVADTASSAAPDLSTFTASRPQVTLQDDKRSNLPAVLHSAMAQDIQIEGESQRQAIVARVQRIRTRDEARRYMAEVQKKVRAYKNRSASGSSAAAKN